MSYIKHDAHSFQAAVGMQEITLSMQENAGWKVLTVATDDCGDACFLNLPLAAARALRDWLNAQDLAE